MRHWACVLALLVGLSGDGYVWSTRARIPVPIERRLDPGGRGDVADRTLRWWRA